MATLAAGKVLSRRRSGLADAWSFSGLSPRQIGRRLLFLASVLAVLAVAGICFILALNWTNKPFAGFLMNERMVPGNVGQYDWTGTEAGLNYQDKILAANGRPIASMEDLHRIIRSLPVGTPIHYSVKRGGEIVELTIRTMRFSWIDLLLTFGITFLSGIAFLCIGAVVFLLKPDTRASWALFLACLFLSVYTITAFDIQSTHWGFIRLYLLVITFFPAALVHLSLVFPEERQLVARDPRVQVLPYLFSGLLIAALEVLYPRPLFLQVYKVMLVYLVLATIILVASSLHAYIKRSSVLGRQRAKVVLFGAALAFPLPAVAHYLSLFLGVPIQLNFLAIPIIVFPASIAYAIVRHNLFDVDIYIKLALGYGIMTALVGITYLSTQAVLTELFLAAFGETGTKISPIVFALSVVLFFNPVHRRVQETVDRVFFRKKSDYKQTISAVSNALASMLNLRQIVQQVIQTVRREMFVDALTLVVVESDTQACEAFVAEDRRDDAPAASQEVVVGYDDPLLALLREERTLITRYDVDEDPRFEGLREAYLASFSAMAAAMVVPMMYQGEVKGVLALGEKKSGEFYTREDVDLLTTMASQAAVAIQNANAHEQVVRYASELAASLRRIQILESIKTNLAKFVPKTVTDLIERSPEAPSLEKREIDVSVLFADITGYTRLSSQMALDEVNQLVERYFGAFLDEILRQGGDVNETAGDGLMVIFQDADPRRHARAAALTALGIRRRTQEINDQLRGQFEPITMHVGVNSGVAAVGATKIEGAAGTRWTFTASGPTTNVAARLAALATGDAVVLSEETVGRVGDEFWLEDLGPQSLKNVAHPVRAYRLLGDRMERQERRQHPRRRISRRVRLWVGGEALEGEAVNASTHGLWVVPGSPMPVEVGKTYRIEILDAGGRELYFIGHVRRVIDGGLGLETDLPLPFIEPVA